MNRINKTNTSAIIYGNEDPRDMRPGVPTQYRPRAQAATSDAAAAASFDSPAVPLDERIENHGLRNLLPDGEGFIEISVSPGASRIGEVHVTVQFEGKVGEPEACGRQHSFTFGQVSQWLNELFCDVISPEAEFETVIAAAPCPKVPFLLDVDRALSVLAREEVVQTPVVIVEVGQ
jgi:hypothetical protein